MSKFYHKLCRRLYRGFDGFYYSDGDEDLVGPFQTRRLAVEDMTKLPWELDLPYMFSELCSIDKYYDFNGDYFD